MLRISATIPEELVRAADQRARELDRSRSWVLSEALRHYLRRPAPNEVADDRPELTPGGGRLWPGLGPTRLDQLAADLRLTPEARVKESERTLRLSDRSVRPARQPLIVFDSFEDYLEWDRREGLW